MAWQALVIAGLSAIQSRQQSRANSRAVSAQQRAGEQAIGEQERARLSFEERTDPFRVAGMAAAPELLNLLGIDIGEFGGGLGEAVEQGSIDRQAEAELTPIRERIAELERVTDTSRGVGAGLAARLPALRQELTDLRTQESNILSRQAQQTAVNTQRANAEAPATPAPVAAPDAAQAPPSMLEQVNPLVSFVRDQGFQDIQESAAARGQLRSGGTLRDLTEFNTNIASTVVPQLQQQRFNQLFNLLGLGSNAAAGQGTAALSTASNIGNILQGVGGAQAQGAINQGNINSNLVGDLAGAFGYFRGNQSAAAGQQVGTIANPDQFGGYA